MTILLARKLASASCVALALFFTACGPSGVGEPCSRPGGSEGCTEGAICAVGESEPGGAGVWDRYVCRALCESQDECAPGEECTGLSGVAATTVRACQPRPEAP